MNVIVFGETGSGKSSLVNLLIGRDDAAVSDGATGCTFDFQKYSTESFNLYDTVGLSEGTRGTIQQSFAVKKLFDLLKSLEGGVSLLILVMKKGRITKSLEENYALFVDKICMQKVPVILAITHCEMDTEPGQWWNENKQTFDSYGWNISGAVCCCSLNPNKAHPAMRQVIESMCDSTKGELQEIIQQKKLVPGWVYEGGLSGWIETALHGVLSVIYGVLLSPIRLWSPGSLKVKENQGFENLVKSGVSVPIASVIASSITTAIKFLEGL